MTDLISKELDHRLSMWRRLEQQGGPKGVAPAVLRDLGMYGGAQGVWVDKVRTSQLTGDGVGITVGLLHTGSSYSDDLSDDGVIYHYPKTNRRARRDAAEVTSTKAAGQLGLPVFVISYPTTNSTKRNVDLAWVEGWDDQAGLFLVSFDNNQPPLLTEVHDEEEPFSLFGHTNKVRREVTVRKGQQRFKFRVLQRYGPQCAFCGLAVLELLDAAHIGPKKEQGSDDARNGLVLCSNHHRAFDAGLCAINPDSLAIQCKDEGPSATALQITNASTTHLKKKPHKDALEWRWQQWQQKAHVGEQLSQAK
jgi:hypothetical protein